ncbi:MAG: ABC transporter ATP-binding protein, partial [Opitutaceae bacterium]|nr:ABC transporter ATP-binding protein [Verrucomicrobiales bacterium]
ILAFEGDGQLAHSVGDYDYYLDKRNKRASAQASQAASNSTKSSGTPEVKKAPAGKPRKLSFKEQQELENIEAKILAAEQEASRIEALFSEADFHRRYGQQIDQFNKELASAKARSAKLFERWQELEAIANSGG